MERIYDPVLITSTLSAIDTVPKEKRVERPFQSFFLWNRRRKKRVSPLSVISRKLRWGFKLLSQKVSQYHDRQCTRGLVL